jgi:hypothetical protein
MVNDKHLSAVVNDVVNNTPTNGNRQERRKQSAIKKKAKKELEKSLRNNDDWTKLEELYQNSIGRFRPIVLLVQAIENNNFVQYLYGDEIEVFNDNLKLLLRDVNAYRDELYKIHAVHAGRVGSCEIDDLPITLDIGNKYFIFNQHFEANISPVFNHLVDLSRLAELRIQQIQQQEQAEKTVLEGNNES